DGRVRSPCTLLRVIVVRPPPSVSPPPRTPAQSYQGLCPPSRTRHRPSAHLAHLTLSAVAFWMPSGALDVPETGTPAPLKSLPRVSVIAGRPCELVTLLPGFSAEPDRPMMSASRRAWSAWSGAYSSVVLLSASGALPAFSDLVTPCCTCSQLSM